MMVGHQGRVVPHLLVQVRSKHGPLCVDTLTKWADWADWKVVAWEVSLVFFQAFRRTFAKFSQAFARGVSPLSAKMIFRWG